MFILENFQNLKTITVHTLKDYDQKKFKIIYKIS